MLYAYPNVPSRAVNFWFLLAAEVSTDRRELGSWFIEQVSLAIHMCRLPLRLFKELGREYEAISCLLVRSPAGPSPGWPNPSQAGSQPRLSMGGYAALSTTKPNLTHRGAQSYLGPAGPSCVSLLLSLSSHLHPLAQSLHDFPLLGEDVGTGRAV